MSKKLMASVAAFLMIALLIAIPQAGISSPKPKVQAKTDSASSATQASSAKVTQLLQSSGYNFKVVNATVWSIDFTGKKLPTFKVILATQDDLVVVFVTIAEKKNLPMTADFLYRLLRFDHSLDRVKVGIDDDGDAFVRVDLTVRILDLQEFKMNIEQVAAAADETYGGIMASLSK